MGCPCQSCRSDKGFLLVNREAAAGGLLDEALVDIGHDLLECGAVESLAQNACPSHDVLSCLHLFSIAVQHLGLDLVPKGFGFGLGFFDQGFQILQGFDLRGNESNKKRNALCIALGLPSKISANMLISVLNKLMSYEQLCDWVNSLESE